MLSALLAPSHLQPLVALSEDSAWDPQSHSLAPRNLLLNFRAPPASNFTLSYSPSKMPSGEAESPLAVPSRGLMIAAACLRTTLFGQALAAIERCDSLLGTKQDRLQAVAPGATVWTLPFLGLGRLGGRTDKLDDYLGLVCAWRGEMETAIRNAFGSGTTGGGGGSDSGGDFAGEAEGGAGELVGRHLERAVVFSAREDVGLALAPTFRALQAPLLARALGVRAHLAAALLTPPAPHRTNDRPAAAAVGGIGGNGESGGGGGGGGDDDDGGSGDDAPPATGPVLLRSESLIDREDAWDQAMARVIDIQAGYKICTPSP